MAFEVKIGELRHPIYFGKIIKEKQDGFTSKKEFVSEFTSRAKIKHLYGKEFWEAKSMQKEKTIKFIIRYDSRITYDYRVSFNNTIYEIDDINNIDELNKWLEIKANVLIGDM
ncbi:MAG: phage head closure protein [Clostridium paraputrificum]